MSRRDLDGYVGPGGIAAKYVISRPSREVANVVINDRSRPDTYRLTGPVEGLLDSRQVRDVREQNASSYGTSRGRQYADEMVLAFVGRIEAANMLRLGYMRDALLAICGPAIEPSGVIDDATITIIPPDPLGADRRSGGLGADYFYNLVPHPHGGDDWVVESDDPSPLIEIIDDDAIATEMGAQGPIMKISAVLDEGDELNLYCGGEFDLPMISAGAYVRATSTMLLQPDGPTQASIEVDLIDPSGTIIGGGSGSLVDSSSELNRKSVVSLLVPSPLRARLRIRLANDGAGNGSNPTLYVGSISMVTSNDPIPPIVSGCPGVTKSLARGVEFHGHRPANLAPRLLSGGLLSDRWAPNEDTSTAPGTDSVPYRRSELVSDDEFESLMSLEGEAITDVVVATRVGAGDVAIAATDIPVEPGVEYTLSASVKLLHGSEGSCHVRIYWISSTGYEVAVGHDPIDLSLAEYVRPSLTATAQPGATKARIEVRATIDSDDRVSISRPMFSFVGSGEYADGDVPGWEWLADGTSQAKPSVNYVVEGVDLDLKTGDSPLFGRQFRDFMLTAKCRDPRVYEEIPTSVEMVAGESSDNTLALPNPAQYPFSVIDWVNAENGIKVLNSSTSVLDGSPTDDSYALVVMDDSVFGVARYAQVEARIGDFTFYDGVFDDADFVLVASNIDTGIVFARLYASGLLEVGYSGGPNISEAEVLTTDHLYTYGSEWSGITGRTFWLRVWAIEDEGGGSMTIHYAAWLNHPSSGPPTISGSAGIDSITATAFVGGGQGGFALGESRSPSPLHPPRVFEYREGSAEPVRIEASERVGGMMMTPATVTISGPITNPIVTAQNSGLVIVTDAVLAEGQEMTIRSDGSVSGDGSVANLIPGTFLTELSPVGVETFTFEGTDMDADVTRAVVSWRRAR